MCENPALSACCLECSLPLSPALTFLVFRKTLLLSQAPVGIECLVALLLGPLVIQDADECQKSGGSSVQPQESPFHPGSEDLENVSETLICGPLSHLSL